MSEEFHSIEESLKEFLAESQNDRNSNIAYSFHKYHNLRIYMDPKKSAIPHFIVRIGISEAMYDLVKGEKISGGLGADEKIVRKWVMRNLERFDFHSVWKKAKKPKVVSSRDDLDD